MPTAVRPEKGPKYYSASVLNEVLSVLSGPKPKPSKMSGREVIKAAYPQILEWRSAGISFEEIADLITEKVPSFKLNVKILRRYMAELETKAGTGRAPVTTDISSIQVVDLTPEKPSRSRSGKQKAEAKKPVVEPCTSSEDTSSSNSSQSTKTQIATDRTENDASDPEREKTTFNELGDL